jgi:nitroimidazol reductase NimA-like FMN-containing flavoprotein (pyridoxamine 5'-phosphate oxidase superfamily)
MCKDNFPYLVSLSHAYDPEGKRLYFHCASEGKKLEYINANPHVWGQAIIDHGYVKGKCNHLYVTVMFMGTVHLVKTIPEKRRILNYMFSRQESPSPTGDVDPHQTRIGKDAELERTTVGWIEIEEMTGKKSAEVTL